MNVREATPEDSDRIRSIARRSFEASYDDILDSDTIDEFITRTYGDGLEDSIQSETRTYLVIETDDGIAGFSQSDLSGDGQVNGRIDWIHVDPDVRGRGIGPRLLTRTKEILIDAGADRIEAQVIDQNEYGNEFYRSRGFERTGSVEVEIGGRTLKEFVYVDVESPESKPIDSTERIEENGKTLYVNYADGVKGSKAPFYTARENRSGDPYGWYCGNCESLDNAMDPMGRIECNACGNRRKATRWDASYL